MSCWWPGILAARDSPSNRAGWTRPTTFGRAQIRPWDLVISDYSLPGLNALAAICIFKEIGPDIPFLVVSGAVGEETAVEVLKSGAHDVLIKNNLARLAPAVERELREAAERRARRKAEESLAASEIKFRRIVETAHEGIWMLDRDGHTTYMNRRMGDMLGLDPADSGGADLLHFLAEKPRSPTSSPTTCTARLTARRPTARSAACAARTARPCGACSHSIPSSTSMAVALGTWPPSSTLPNTAACKSN